MPTISFFQAIIRELRYASIKPSICLIFLIVVLQSCQHQTLNVLGEKKEEAKSNLNLRATEGRWYLGKQPYSGLAYVYYSNGNVKERIQYKAGKKEGVALKWFVDGSRKANHYYKANRLQGIAKTWWPNGKLSSVYTYQKGVKHGRQLNWHSNGQLARENILQNGREEGMQKAWLQNGKMYVNYEARDGKTYGLRKAKLCYELREEEILQ